VCSFLLCSTDSHRALASKLIDVCLLALAQVGHLAVAVLLHLEQLLAVLCGLGGAARADQFELSSLFALFACVSGVDVEALPSSVVTVRDVQNWTHLFPLLGFQQCHANCLSRFRPRALFSSRICSQKHSLVSPPHTFAEGSFGTMFGPTFRKQPPPSRLTETLLLAVAPRNLKQSPQVTFSFWGRHLESLPTHGTRMNQNVLILLI
jgi:hypothetical protein